VADNAPKNKFNDLKVLLGMLMVLAGIVSEVQSRIGKYSLPGGVWWTIAGVLLLLNGLGILPRRKKA
jgi:hypothetical protein